MEIDVDIWEPKSLKNYYLKEKMDINISNFGKFPFGYSIFGTVIKA